MDAIFNRRSIRQFTDEYVSDEKIRQIIQAGMAAPNAFGTNEWEFIVIKSKEGKEKLVKAQPWAKPAQDANTLILVCGDLSKEKREPLLVQNCSAAIENMLIAATHLDLGSLWLGAYGSDEIVSKLRKAYSIPQNIIPIGIVVIGQTNQNRRPQNRYLEKQVHFEVFK